MLISYPVLGVPQLKESPKGGRYPLGIFTDNRHEGLTAGWHGGLHLEVSSTTGQGPVVRAIADGTVVAYRVPTKKPTDPKELEKHVLNYTGGWTDDGFVLLKHEKECGENRPVVFYSLYMHLSSVSIKTSKNKQPGAIQKNPQIVNRDGTTSPLPLKRKEIMGEAGSIEGQPNQIHFEIFASDEDFWKFFQRCQGSMDPWGELYFVIPEGQPVYAKKPGWGGLPQPSNATPFELTLALRYHAGDIHFRSLDEHGLELEAWPVVGGEYFQEDCVGDEYEIYQEAERLDKTRLSRSYELLRFGRYMDWPDLVDDDKPPRAHCWHFIPMLNGWVDFADDGVRRYSDADFLEWQWQDVAHGGQGFDPSNGTCQISQLFSAMDENGEGHLTDVELRDWIQQAENKALLRRLVVQAQSEWDGQDPDGRWGWVKAMWSDPVKHEMEALGRKIDWVEAQKRTATQSLSALKQRVVRARGWHSNVTHMKAEAESALASAQQASAQARKALDDFVKDVGGQKTSLAPLTPVAKHQKAVDTEQAKRKKALESAKDAEGKIASQVKAMALVLAKAEAWASREEAKLQAAEDGIALADPLIAYLQKSLEAASKKTVPAGAVEQAEKDFDTYKEYMKALQFWEEVPNLPNSKVWHFHPLAFIEHFRKCHWLSEEELAVVYSETPEAIRKQYRVPLNRVMWKYGITSPLRQTHFLGQGWVESSIGKGALTAMREKSTVFPKESLAEEKSGYYKNPQDFYYTHMQKYEGKNGNIDKEDLRDGEGKPADIDAAVKKSNQDLADKTAKAEQEMADLDGRIKQLMAKTPRDEKALKALRVERQVKNTELKKFKDMKKDLGERYQDVAKQTIDASKSRCGDGMKFRGRGMKQLTGRYNYMRYWCYRGWLSRSDFDDPWWQGPWNAQESNGKRVPQIPNPERVCESEFNCIDTAGWYWEAGKSRPINRFIQEGQAVEKSVIREIAIAINGKNAQGQPNGLEARVDCTKKVAKVMLDGVE